MGEHTEISWCDATFNIVWGCTKVSPACTGCYAEAWARRYGVGWGPTAPRKTFGPKHWAEPAKWARKARKDGVRTRVFTSSMGDVFEDHPTVAAERLKLWGVIDSTWEDIDWLILTKRIDRVMDCLRADGRPADYLARRLCWIGTTAENQEWYNRRVIHLREIPAVVRFVSCEPLLGAIDADRVPCPYGPHRLERGESGYCTHCCHDADPDLFGFITPLSDGDIHWIVSGGMSGPKATPSHPDWFRKLRDRCQAAGVAYHHKQWGEWKPGRSDWAPGEPLSKADWIEPDGTLSEWGKPQTKTPYWVSRSDGLVPLGKSAPHGSVFMTQVGKKAAGRLLDGRTWDEFPTPKEAARV